MSASTSTPSKVSQRLSPAFHRRVQRDLQASLHDAQVDAVLVDDWRDVAYLTGFFHTPTERPVVVVASADEVVLCVPELERDYAQSQEAAVDRLVSYPEYPGDPAPFEVLASALGGSGQRWGHGPSLRTGMLEDLVGAMPGVDWTMIRTVERMRLVKRPEEVALHREAARLGDVMLDAGRGLVQDCIAGDGRLPTEAELAGQVIAAGKEWMYATHTDIVVVPMLTGGLVYSGANSAHPHGLVTDHRLVAGETLILSLGGAVGGRYAESERTFVLGEPSAEQADYFETDRLAQQVGTDAILPGARCRDVNAACLAVIRDAGHGHHLRHRQGHGIGLNFHEPPWLEAGDDTLLQAGMVVSSEPGIYVPGHGGYRISDTVLVTDDGPERLTTHPRDLEASIIAL